MGTIGNLTRPSRAALSPSKEALLRKRLQGGIQTLHHGDPAAQIPARKQQGSARLSFAQQRLWFLHELDPQSSAYNETTALRICGPLDLNAFEEALNRIHERHGVLSAHFPATDGTPMQVSHPARIRCELADVQHLPASQREVAATELAQKEVGKPFDLAEGPVARYLLIRCKPDEHLFIVVMHHIVTDGWSVALYFQELAALYDGATRGVSPELPALPIQYRTLPNGSVRLCEATPSVMNSAIGRANLPAHRRQSICRRTARNESLPGHMAQCIRFNYRALFVRRSSPKAIRTTRRSS